MKKSKRQSLGFQVGAHVLIEKRGKYLVLKRSLTDLDGPGDWDLPGGGVKPGEQPFRAVAREAKEEAGVRVRVIKVLTTYALPFYRWWSVETTVLARYVSGTVRLSREHSEYRWVSRPALRKLRPRGHVLASLFVQK